VLQHHPPIPIVDDLVRLTYTRNSGVAFGLGAGTRFPFYLFSLVAAAGIVWLVWRRRVNGGVSLGALALILGGALGNLVDRISTGEVVDFILLSWRGHDFPVFNVADSAVTVGVALFALAWRPPHEHGAEAAPAAPSHDAGATSGATSGATNSPQAGEEPNARVAGESAPPSAAVSE
jgi:signal peptidase II